MRNENALAYDVFGALLSYGVITVILFFALNQSNYDPRNAIEYFYNNGSDLPLLAWLSIGGGIAFFFTWSWFNPFSSISGEYGDAKIATKSDIKKMGLFPTKGIIIGKAYGKYVRVEQPLSIMLLAPPGTGKTAGIVIPTLLSCSNSVVAFDVKGELYSITSKRRAEFSKVIRLSLGESDSAKWNPLAKECLPEKWEDIEIKVSRLSSVLYATDKADHWSKEAMPMFLFFALYLIHKNGETSIPDIRAFALSSDSPPQEFIAELLDGLDNETTPPRIIEEGNGALAKAENEFAGVFSSFKADLNAFADPYIKKTLSGNDFNFADFRKERHSLYLIVKAEDVERLAPIVRLFFEELSLYILSNQPEKDDHIISMIIDEMPRLGKLDQVINAPALMRGNRGNALLIAQDYAQIEEIYGKTGPGKINGTIAYRIILAQNNLESAESISKHIGDETRSKESVSTGGNQLVGSTSKSLEGTKLFSTQKLMSLKEEDCIIIAQNHANRPIKGSQVRWYKEKSMKDLHGEYIDV